MELTTRIRSGARSAVRTGYTSVSRALPVARMEPAFLIAGAQRCGTTSLFRMLLTHPAVRPPAMTKGIHYFDTADRFRRGPNFYRAHFPLARPGAGPTLTGEASPYYVFHPLAPRRIAEELPEVRVVVLLRDPVERAFSAHKQETWRGFETLSFADALEAEPERLRGEEERIVADPGYQSLAHQHHAYVGRGRYAHQVRRMHDALGPDQVMVLDAGDFFSAPEQHWPRLLNHLGLPHAPLTRTEKANARPSVPMPQALRAWLTGQFHDSDAELAEILGRQPSWRHR